MVHGFEYILRTKLSKELKLEISPMDAFGPSPHTHYATIHKRSPKIGNVTHDIFMLPSNIMNICHKRAEEIREKRAFDPINIWI
jgi:hypothetical protein